MLYKRYKKRRFRIRREDFDMSKLDQNGDAVIRVEFSGNNNGWKKDWVIDGAKLLWRCCY